MNASTTRPETVEAFLDKVGREYAALSARLKLIACHVERYREQLAHWDIRRFSSRCGANPSAVVRFAQHFGFSGFVEMRELFRSQWSDGLTDLNHEAEATMLSTVADSVLHHNIVALRNLRRTLDFHSLERAIGLLERAEIVWIVGAKEAFPIATYLEQGLRRVGVHANFLGALESLHTRHAHAVRAGDVVVALSLVGDVQEVLDVAKYGLKQGAQLVALSNAPMSRLVRDAHASIVFCSSADCSFHAVAAAINLAQILFVVLDKRGSKKAV